MADRGYHSPQFSEDIAWLPEWLQPHQLPAFGEHAKDEQTFSPLACHNSAYFPRNACDGQDGLLFTAGDARYSGCHLFLSGDDNSPMGNTLSSGNALQLHLHLSSSVAISKSSDQLNGNSQRRKCEANIAPLTRPISEASISVDNRSHQKEVGNEKTFSSIPLVVCKSKESHKSPLESHIKVNQVNRQGFQEKIDPSILQSIDIKDTVELSITASEALVISEILSSSLLVEPLTMATAVLEIALRVKQARNQCHLDILDSDSTLSTDILDDTDQLSDLDETIMADALDDVGLSVTQIIPTPDNSLSIRRSSHNNGSLYETRQQNIHSIASLDLTRPISASNVKNKENARRKEVRAQDIDIEGSVSQGCDASPIRNVNSFTAVQMDFKGDKFKDGEIAKHVDAGATKGIKKYFIEETSFISESMDIANEQIMEQRPVAGAEIIASSSTPLTDLPQRTNSGDKSTHEKLVLSQDPENLFSAPLEDPLCSVVPCSISSENDLMDLNQDMTHGRKTTTTDADVILPSKPLVLGEKCEFSRVNVESSGMPKRKHFNSLKPYSMIVSDQKAGGETILQNELTLSNMDNNFMNLFPTEENINYFVSKKCDLLKISSKPMEKDVNMDEPLNCHTHGCNDYDKLAGPVVISEKINGTSAIGETKDDSIEVLVRKHEGKHSPPIFSNKARHRLRACKIILHSDSEDESLQRLSTPQKRKHCSRCSTKEVRCRDRIDTTLTVPACPSLPSITPDKGSLPNRKIHFSDATYDNNANMAAGKMQHVYGYHGSCYEASEKVKKPDLPCKPESRKKRIGYLTSYSTRDEKGMIFQDLEFLLTGFSSRKEKELRALIRNHGGFVLSSVPSYWPDVRGRHRVQYVSWKLPIVLSPKKVQSTKFLYGCAINAWMLDTNWLFDSLQANAILPPKKYMTILIQTSERSCMRIGEPLCLSNYTFIFDRVAIMLYGKASFCTKFSKIIKYGGGQVFKSLQQLVKNLKSGKNSVGAILVEDEGSIPRILKHCALEHNLQTLPASWIINSLFSGKLLPLKKDRCAPLHRIKMPKFPQAEALDMSEEI